VNKKLAILILSICTISLLAILYMNFKKREIITPNTYQEAMTYVKKIHLSEVQEKIDNKEDILLINTIPAERFEKTKIISYRKNSW